MCPFSKTRASKSTLWCGQTDRLFGCGKTRFCTNDGRPRMRVCEHCSLTQTGLRVQNYEFGAMDPGSKVKSACQDHFHFYLMGDPGEFRCMYCTETFEHSQRGLRRVIRHIVEEHSTFDARNIEESDAEDIEESDAEESD